MTSTDSPSSERIRAAGLRATLQRASVLDVLSLQPGHHTV
jgi:Fe2+ or Zn2+ uptake regulation protein